MGIYEGSCASWWLWGLVALGLGRLKPDTTGSSHRGRPASDYSTFPLISNIIYIPSLGGESSELRSLPVKKKKKKKKKFPLCELGLVLGISGLFDRVSGLRSLEFNT